MQREVTDSANRLASSLRERAAASYTRPFAWRLTSKTSPRHVGETVTLKGWLHNRRSSGKLHFLAPRRHRHHPGGDVEGRGRPGGLRLGRSPRPGERLVVTGADRAEPARPAGSSSTSAASRSSAGARVPDHAEGARRRLPDGSPAPLAALAAAAGHPARPARSSTPCRDFFDARGFILVDTPIFTPSACEGTTTLFPVQYFEDTTAYLTQTGQLYNEANAMALGGCTLRSDVPRREVEDAPAPHRVLDGRAGDGLRPRGRQMDLAEDLSSRSSRACSRSGPPRAQGARARHAKLESVKAPFPRITTTRPSRAARGGPAVEWGDDFGATTRLISQQFDRPVFVTLSRRRSKRST